VSPLVKTAPGFRMMSYKMVHLSEPTNVVTETLFFTAPSTSGLVTTYPFQDKVQIFRLLLQEKDAVVGGTRDTSEFDPIPMALCSSSPKDQLVLDP